MKDFTAIDFLKFWIELHGFPDWKLERRPEEGRQGVVFFLKAKGENTSPTSLALKTVNPEKALDLPRLVEELQRELGKWIRLPYHRNVVSASPFKIAAIRIPNPAAPGSFVPIKVPVVPMERMDGSLREWVNSDRFSMAARLVALAQTFNGLVHLYSNGIEGHGDLKPENILFADIRKRFSVPATSWLSTYPWEVKIADLGWADAWKDYGYTDKAFRPYVAPERLGQKGYVVPERSDIFSMGLIAAELVQGRHPCEEYEEAKLTDVNWTTSQKKWTRKAERKDWDLKGIPSARVARLVDLCLDPDPSNRPTALECVHVLCEELKEVHDLDIEPTLQAWGAETIQNSAPYYSSNLGRIERLQGTKGLGEIEEAKTVTELREIFSTIQPDDLYTLQEWTRAAELLLSLLEEESSPEVRSECERIRQQARHHFEKTLGPLTHVELKGLATRMHDSDWIQPFEHFAHLVGHLGRLSSVEFEQALAGEWDIGDLAVAGFAYHMSNRARMASAPARGVIEYLDIAIEKSLTQAVPYYFRALRKQEILFFEECGLPREVEVSTSDIQRDLELACQLDPDWSEPRGALNRLMKSKNRQDGESES